jgi:uncharacterized protein (TIGR02444 family)
MMDNATPFWRFSLAYYGKKGIPEALIALQDRLGIDVNLVLFALWLATEGRALDEASMKAIGERSRGWQAKVVAPLREVRRALKENPPLVAAALAEPFRGKTKALELEAEHLQQDALYALTTDVSKGTQSPDVLARENLDTYARFAGRNLPEESKEALLRALREMAPISR